MIVILFSQDVIPFLLQTWPRGKFDIPFRQSCSETLHTALSDWIALTLVLLLLVPVEKNLQETLWEKGKTLDTSPVEW